MTLKLNIRATRWNLANMTAYITAQVHLVVDARHNFSKTASMTPLVTSKGANIETIAEKELLIERS